MSLLINPFGVVVDFAPGDILNFKFTSTDATGTPTTLGGAPVVSIYKDDDTAESVTGVTLTADFDGRTGLNNLKIDTSQDSVFYAIGHTYDAVITTGTVGAISVVGTCAGHFELSRLLADVWEATRRILEVEAEIRFTQRAGGAQLGTALIVLPRVLRTRAP